MTRRKTRIGGRLRHSQEAERGWPSCGALARLLEAYRASDAVVPAIPAGGVPVAPEIAARLGLARDVAPVSKMLLPWTAESGFGAVAFDGSSWMEAVEVRRFGLSEVDVERAASDARAKVERRLAWLRVMAEVL